MKRAETGKTYLFRLIAMIQKPHTSLPTICQAVKERGGMIGWSAGLGIIDLPISH